MINIISKLEILHLNLCSKPHGPAVCSLASISFSACFLFCSLYKFSFASESWPYLRSLYISYCLLGSSKRGTLAIINQNESISTLFQLSLQDYMQSNAGMQKMFPTSGNSVLKTYSLTMTVIYIWLYLLVGTPVEVSSKIQEKEVLRDPAGGLVSFVTWGQIKSRQNTVRYIAESQQKS